LVNVLGHRNPELPLQLGVDKSSVLLRVVQEYPFVSVKGLPADSSITGDF
jgi:hypothetical protein